jgi:hypothetical protein
MSNTGVGGIKDSQGNYDIVGKSNSTLGTRGGTLLVPVGDPVGQTAGTLSVNVYTPSTLVNPEVISLKVQEFVPGTPPSVATPVSIFSMSSEDAKIIINGASVVMEPTTVSGTIGSTTSCAIAASTVVLETSSSGHFIGNQATTGFFASLSCLTILSASISNLALSQSFVMPFGGDIVDVSVANPPNGSTTTVNRIVPSVGTFSVASLVAGAPQQLLRLSTFGSASGASFNAGDTITISIGAVPAGSVRVCVYILRTSAVT